ncbi:elongation factor Ts, mitochondrial [Cloeon dipterum]|uniref:elongation factor Ts, mitochondrial n=1 Tax=Cloeon dipterum TaxID=197152 RepID=UPI0032208A67
MQRLLHSSAPLWASLDKAMLGKLRKKTGYTFSNCKKALEVCGNDITKAEEWLHEQAKALGWAKANKLEGRATAQGLVGVASDSSCVAMVEVNCETDFVARNKTFRSLVERVAAACLNHAKTLPQDNLTKSFLSADQLKTVPCGKEGGPLADHVALAIGNVGENLSLRRCAVLQAPPRSAVHLSGYTHPAENSLGVGPVLCGRYGALVAFKAALDSAPKTQILGRQLCQHIVGMCPERIGDPEKDSPNPDTDSESVLIFQEFLLDVNQTVGNVLEEHDASILDFARFECGEKC